ncbi:MAG: transcription antitermination factor NusB [bacterium]|nr:transcription antitermination factor NusB [bacterium]
MKKLARKTRILALEVCYQLDIQNTMTKQEAIRVLKEKHIDEELYPKVMTLVCGVIKNRNYIDNLLAKYSINWHISRMSYIDRNILRIGVYEMIFSEVPDIVVINEAIEISKIYSSQDSGKFINGILDRIRKEVVTKDKKE